MTDQAPRSVNDAILGYLDWDDSLGWWVGSVAFAPGHQVEVFVTHGFDTSQPADEVAIAGLCLARIREREMEYRRWSAEHLSPKRWNTDEPMTVSDIAELIRVASLEFGYDGGVRIFWDDQDRLFWGHNVVTDIDPGGVCVMAGMQ